MGVVHGFLDDVRGIGPGRQAFIQANGDHPPQPAAIPLQQGGPRVIVSISGTLEERFTKCSAPDAHGKTSHLTTVERADLIEYLKSL